MSVPLNVFHHGRRWKIFAGTFRRLGVDLSVRFHGAGTQVATAFQILNERVKAFELLRGGPFILKISDQADADTFFVQRFTGQVPAFNLSLPTVSDFDFSIRHPSPVADDKMVGQSVLHAPFFLVINIHRLRASVARGAMVNHNITPFALHDLHVVQRAADIG